MRLLRCDRADGVIHMAAIALAGVLNSEGIGSL